MIKNSTETRVSANRAAIGFAAVGLFAAVATSAALMYFGGKPPVALTANVCVPETTGGLRIAPKMDLELSNGCARLSVASSGSAGLIPTYVYCKHPRGPQNWVPQQVEQELQRNCAGG